LPQIFDIVSASDNAIHEKCAAPLAVEEGTLKTKYFVLSKPNIEFYTYPVYMKCALELDLPAIEYLNSVVVDRKAGNTIFSNWTRGFLVPKKISQ